MHRYKMAVMIMASSTLMGCDKGDTITDLGATCNAPFKWQMGSLPAEFNLKEQQVIRAAKRAAAIWNNELDQPAIQYTPGEGTPINFIYGQAQSDVEFLNPIISKVSELNEQIDSLPEPDSQESFGSKEALLIMEAALTNYLNDELNRRQGVDGAANIATESGISWVEDIQIYVSRNEFDLTNLLAHEFGHALGIPDSYHVVEVNAIMHERAQTDLMNPNYLSLTESDRRALARVCSY